MARKSTDFKMAVHYPDNRNQTSYQEIIDQFRLEQIKKYLSQYPPKIQLALLEELEKRLQLGNL